MTRTFTPWRRGLAAVAGSAVADPVGFGESAVERDQVEIVVAQCHQQTRCAFGEQVDDRAGVGMGGGLADPEPGGDLRESMTNGAPGQGEWGSGISINSPGALLVELHGPPPDRWPRRKSSVALSQRQAFQGGLTESARAAYLRARTRRMLLRGPHPHASGVVFPFRRALGIVWSASQNVCSRGGRLPGALARAWMRGPR